MKKALGLTGRGARGAAQEEFWRKWPKIERTCLLCVGEQPPIESGRTDITRNNNGERSKAFTQVKEPSSQGMGVGQPESHRKGMPLHARHKIDSPKGRSVRGT